MHLKIIRGKTSQKSTKLKLKSTKWLVINDFENKMKLITLKLSNHGESFNF